MKLFHISDLHIGLRLHNRDFSEDQLYIFKEIADRARQEQPDAILIAGDVYNRTDPSADAVALFDRFVALLREAAPDAELMFISGNHDSAARLNVFRSVLGAHHIHMIGQPPQKAGEYMEQVTLQDEWGPVHFYLLPFVRPSQLRELVGTKEDGSSLSYDEALHRLFAREQVNTAERNVLVSHQFYLPAGEDAAAVERADSEIITIGNIDLVRADVLAPFDYAALGHIHCPMRVGSEFARYCGTPLACSVSEAGQQKGIILVELGEKGQIATRVLPLKPLREIRQLEGTLEQLLQQPTEDYVTVLVTDKTDLNTLDMNDRLRAAFPRLLEIKRETAVPRIDTAGAPAPALVREDAFDLCRDFLKDLSEEEAVLLRDVINEAKEMKL